MAKLSRRKRKATKVAKETKGKLEAENKKITKQREQKKHICIFHKYQELLDGTYVCTVCGHHFTKKMEEAELRKYLYMNKEYSLREIRKKDCSLLKVTYGKDTRGVIKEYEVEKMRGRAAVKAVCETWEYFTDITQDLHFDNRLFTRAERYLGKQSNMNVNRISPMFFLELETIFDEKTGNVNKIEDYYRTEKRWSYKTAEDKVHYYEVYPVLNGILPSFPTAYYFDADPVAARKYVFDKNGVLEKEVVCLWNGMLFTVTT